MRNSNVGGISYKAPPSALPQGRGSLRSSREEAWQLTGSWGLPAGVRPGLVGPWPLLGNPCPPSLPLAFLFLLPSSLFFFIPLLSFSVRWAPRPGCLLPLPPPPPLAPLLLGLTLPPSSPHSQALCAAVTTTDLAETQALLGCGAGVNCFSGDPEAPTPLALAEQAGQTLQMEFLRNNRTTGEQLVGQSSLRDGASLLLGPGPLQGMLAGACGAVSS